MNITFCVSSIPNQRIVSGISAATGRLRPNRASGAPAASNTRHAPATMPSGTPMLAASRKPRSTRLSVAAMLSMSARSLSRLGKLRMTSPGLGRMTGEMNRSSEPMPEVANHHTATISATAPTPTRRRVIGGGGRRSANSERCDGPVIYRAPAWLPPGRP